MHETLKPRLDQYDFIAIHSSHHKLEIKYQIAMACRLLSPAGSLLLAGANDTGGKVLGKILSEFGLSYQEISKYKHRILYVKSIDTVSQTMVTESLRSSDLQKRDDGLWTMAGLFSWDKIDVGTKFLLDTLNNIPIKGRGADFGSGIGILPYYLCPNHPKITYIDAVEYDIRAVTAAQKNLSALDTKVTIHHADATLFKSNSPYDFIVMNPPFHAGKVNDISLGQRFILNALDNLKSSGVLYIVANTHLPYETIIKSNAASFEIIGQKHGFKIIKAIK
jgi:16S rRNA (guanine1207-N2)-methyltransferase